MILRTCPPHILHFFLASRILRLFRMEWVDHLDRVGQVGAQCAHRQTFRSNFLPQLEEHPIPFANCEDAKGRGFKFFPKTARSSGSSEEFVQSRLRCKESRGRDKTGTSSFSEQQWKTLPGDFSELGKRQFIWA